MVLGPPKKTFFYLLLRCILAFFVYNPYTCFCLKYRIRRSTLTLQQIIARKDFIEYGNLITEIPLNGCVENTVKSFDGIIWSGCAIERRNRRKISK